MERMPFRRRFVSSLAKLAAVAILSAPACRTSSSTGVHVHVQFSGVATSQLIFSVLSSDLATTLVPDTPRPMNPAGDLSSPQDVIIYLPDSAAGTVVCRASAAALPGAADQRSVEVAVHAITDVTLTLSPT